MHYGTHHPSNPPPPKKKAKSRFDPTTERTDNHYDKRIARVVICCKVAMDTTYTTDPNTRTITQLCVCKLVLMCVD